MSNEINSIQLLEEGFSLEVGKYTDTPLAKNDQLLYMDTAGHVLIAREPLSSERESPPDALSVRR